MYSGLIHTHSGLRWVVFILILMAIIYAVQAMNSKQPVSATGKRVSFFALISTHIQIVIGLILYFKSPKVQFSSETMKNDLLRFFTMEHVVMMLIAVTLVTIGNRMAKSGNGKKMFWYYLIGLIVIIAGIPWPFRAALGGQWF